MDYGFGLDTCIRTYVSPRKDRGFQRFVVCMSRQHRADKQVYRRSLRTSKGAHLLGDTCENYATLDRRHEVRNTISVVRAKTDNFDGDARSGLRALDASAAHRPRSKTTSSIRHREPTRNGRRPTHRVRAEELGFLDQRTLL